MIAGHSIFWWIVVAFVAVCVFFLAQWLIPLLFHVVSVTIPEQIVNILSALLALGVVVGSHRGWTTA